MEKVLIIPDIHLKIDRAERIIRYECADKIILLGDIFDDFGDTVEETANAAEWLKGKLKDDKFIILRSNHDIAYQHSGSRWTRCSGWTVDKSRAINKTLTKKDWDKTKWFHVEENYLFSHAGVNPIFISDKVITKEDFLIWLNNECKNADEHIKLGRDYWVYGAGMIRGGWNYKGGLLWQDAREFEPIPYFNQCVGHTPCKNPVWENANLFLDTHLNYYGVMQNGKIETKCYYNL